MLVLVTAALAGALPIRVVGEPPPRSMAVVLQAAGAKTLVAGCNDAARGPDEAADGVWSCGPLDPPAGTWAFYLLRDGVLLDGGVVEGVGTAAVAGVWASLDDGRLSLSTAGTGPVGTARAPAAFGPTLLVRISNYPGEGAPMVAATVAGSSSQIPCRDDGQFPDLGMNDQQPTCAGAVPEGAVSLALQTNTGERLDLGRVEGASPLVYATVDYATRAVDAAPFDLALPPAPAGTGLTGAAAEAPPAEASAAPSLTTTAAPAAAAPPVASAAPSVPDGVLGPGWGILPWLTLAGGAGLGFGVGRWRGRRIPPPEGLRRVRSPALLPGGPSVDDGSVVLRATRIEATTAALVDRLVAARRTILVLPEGMEPPVVAGGGLWVATSLDHDIIAGGIRSIAALPGPELALVVVGVGTVVDLGGVANDPLQQLVDALPPGTFTALVVPGDAGAPRWPAWRVGPELACERA